MRTSYLNWRFSGIWDWATLTFCQICFCCPSFQNTGLLVTSLVLGFLLVQLPPCELSQSWASAVLGLCLTGAGLRLFQFSSVQFSRSVVSHSSRPHESQHARPPCPSPTPGVQSDSRPLSQWCHPAISSSVVPFSSCLREIAPDRSSECVISMVLSLYSKNLKWRTSVIALLQLSFIWQAKKIHPQDMKVSRPKRREGLNLGAFYYMIFLFPLSLPYVNWASQKGVCVTWGSHSSPQTFLCSIFAGFSLLCLLATSILDSFFLF